MVMIVEALDRRTGRINFDNESEAAAAAAAAAASDHPTSVCINDSGYIRIIKALVSSVV
jgi:hypothetical protein